jgi:hypothetical protein
MQKLTLIALLLAVALPVAGQTGRDTQPETSAGITFTVSKDKTSSDIPLSFEVQQSKWKYEGIAIWGKIRNDVDDQIYESVSIIFTAYDAKGRFLGRNSVSVTPSKIGEGEVGYVNGGSIELNQGIPARIEWKTISGRY